MLKYDFITPKGIHGAEEDPLAARRRKIAEHIRNNEDVPVAENGELLDGDLPEEAAKSTGMTTPKGIHG